MPKYNWSKYNMINEKLSSKLIKFNDLNKINFIEDGLYNHIRDIFCLTILFNRKKIEKQKYWIMVAICLLFQTLNQK